MDSWEIDRFVEDNDPYRDSHFYEEIDTLKKKIKKVKGLIKEVNKYLSKESYINTTMSNKLFDIETIINEER